MTSFLEEIAAVGKTDWCNATTTAQECVAHGNGGASDNGNSPCHRAGKWALCNICELPSATYYPNESYPSFWDKLFGHTPTDLPFDPSPHGFAKGFIIFNHILPFITTIIVMWAISYKVETLQNRIGNDGIFFLNLGMCFLAISSMCEFANHELLMDWNMCFDSSSNITYLLFYIFNCSGNTLVAFGLRKKGTSLFRKFTFSLDGLTLLIDWFLVVCNILIPIGWFNPYGWTIPFRFFNGTKLNRFKGRPISAGIFIPVASFAATLELGRIWTNLGPTNKTYGRYLLLAFLTAFSPILGVGIDVVMTRSPYQWWHGLLALAFGLNEVFLTFCLLGAVSMKAPAAPIGERERLVKQGV